MKVLIAEDDENSRQVLEAVLQANGHQVVSFENGLKALNYLQTKHVDLIISDILMPEMDGYGLCKAVKQHPVLQKIPFIFYTATYTSPQDERFAMTLGANKFLLKPMVMDDLMRIVNQVMASDTKTKTVKGRGLYRSSPTKIDKQHADRLREKLDKKLVELNDERKKLLESEARFRDFAESSADWFWESDAELNIKILAGGPAELAEVNLVDLANACHSHSSNEMLKVIQAHQKLSDYIVHFTDKAAKVFYVRLSGKPLFDAQNVFIGYRGVGRDVSETIALNRRVEFLASHDDLTGLPNRNMFRQRLEHAIAKAQRSGNQVLLIFFDLDNFKMINDTLGHEAGDQLLIMATKRIKERARASDVLCRIGGDEFVMIMEGASPQDGHRLVRDIIKSFGEPFKVKDQQVYTTVSIGLSVYPDDATDPNTLLLYADLAMYRAKQNGRNGFEFYTADLNFIAHQWMEIENGIRQALAEDQFFLVYQPQINNQNGELVGIEALLRWRQPERGLIPPLEFIKIAEQSYLINEIGEFVLETCCHQLRKWLDAGYKIPRISVNVSPRHLRSEHLSRALLAITGKYQIPHELICIEITEHALLEDAEIVKKNMRLVKESGFHVSLDDFGMGHSSLLYLKRWAVDEVKIDQTFINGLVTNEEDRQIVKAIVALGLALGLNLVGEGVESKAQADILASSGCDVMQGFYFSHPLSASDIQPLFKKAT